MKLMLCGAFSRNTDLLILDEPSAALDPLMRDSLNKMLLNYLDEKNGRTVFFSTHNISDMEKITDYLIIMEHGQIVEKASLTSCRKNTFSCMMTASFLMILSLFSMIQR